MRKAIVPILVIVAVIGIIFVWAAGIYNTSIKLEQKVKGKWGDVETAYQRRDNLIGNLVNTVQGAAEFEKSTLEGVIKARSEATNIKVDPSNAEDLAEFSKAQNQVSSSLSRLLVTVEQYPDLKANQNFLKLQDELASTENTIQTAHVRFNEKVTDYNEYVLPFPNNIIAGMFGHREKPYFKAVEGAEKAPEVKFDFNK